MKSLLGARAALRAILSIVLSLILLATVRPALAADPPRCMAYI